MRVFVGLLAITLLSLSAEAQELRLSGHQVLRPYGGYQQSFRASEAFDFTVRNPGPVEVVSHDGDELIIEYRDPRIWYRENLTRGGSGWLLEGTREYGAFWWVRPRTIPLVNPPVLRIAVPGKYLRHLKILGSDDVTLSRVQNHHSNQDMSVFVSFDGGAGRLDVDGVALSSGLHVSAATHANIQVQDFWGALRFGGLSADIQIERSRDLDLDLQGGNLEIETFQCEGSCSVLADSGGISLWGFEGNAFIDLIEDGEIDLRGFLGNALLSPAEAEVYVQGQAGGFLDIRNPRRRQLELQDVKRGFVVFDSMSRACPAALREGALVLFHR